MKYTIWMLAGFILFLSCKEDSETPKKWTLQNTIPLEGVNPIGITQLDGSLWLSDGDHNRLVKISAQGNVLATVDSLDRPMHIDASDGSLFVSLYGKDEILTLNAKDWNKLENQQDAEDSKNPMDRSSEWNLTNDSLDAPAGVSVFRQEKAIADFYNNRILYYNGTDWISFGKEGKAEGEFYYPTDVQLTEDKIWVADAYNNRIQVFDKRGKFLRMMGQDQRMNAATGIYVTDKDVFITDFENDRVLVFDIEGNLIQEITDAVEKPTDILESGEVLYILNYRNGSISTFTWAEIPKSISEE